MVYLTPRFLFLTALVATAALPSFVLQSDARAVDLAERHHDKSSHSSASALASKGKSKTEGKLAIPLPSSAKGKSNGSKKSKKHRKGGHKHKERDVLDPKSDTWFPLDPLVEIDGPKIGDGRNSDFSNEHSLLENVLERDATQVPFSLHRRSRSRIYGKREQIGEIEGEGMTGEAAPEAKPMTASDNTWDKFNPRLKIGKYEIGDGRGGSYSEMHSLLPRSPEPHHHHHGHHRYDKVVVNGDHDDVDVHKRSLGSGIDHQEYERRSPHHHHHHHGQHDKVIVNGDNDNVHVHEKRAPHHHHHHTHDKVVINGSDDKVHVHERREPHHHHHHHDDHHTHDKTVINGNHDDVHVHERRDPNHHHHHHHGEHKMVINGDNDDVHIHNRGVGHYDDILDVQIGIGNCGRIDGHHANCFNANEKRSDPLETMNGGVPGTVDIMTVGGPMRERLASLILSPVPDNTSTSTSNGSTTLDGTKVAYDVDTDTAPFVLDASNTTQTQFFLVVSSPSSSSAPSAPSTSLSNTLAVLKAAASSKNNGSEMPDIKVMLGVPVFEPSEAAMKPYCATYDPNPVAPAPLYMERCFSDSDSDPETAGKMTETSLHKSQTFAYNPNTGIVRPMWFDVTGVIPPAPAVNSTDSGYASSSTSDREQKQMNIKIPSSNKNAPAHIPEPVSGPAQSVVGNITQVANGTAPSQLPVSPSALPSSPISNQNMAGPRNVTLVFTPIAAAVHSVNGPSLSGTGVPAPFKPVGDDTSVSASASGSSEDDDEDTSSSASASSASDDTSDGVIDPSGTPSDTPDATDVNDMSMSVSATVSAAASGTTTETESTSTSDTSVPPTSTIDEAAIVKMYQLPQRFL